ncbi:hypothetical protein [Streptomyces sp. ISL-94]|uniref:hypothetical protein n=1 Tax=Streptomyces sp. ISL-94 TaxID=2819190 RepID=UPI001BEBA598|nr:hypothetical protein [Streptomyces sp. ISL-94]MBT2480661.1 hypothetical protein [Streptomyces sp. ISL-94]
MPLPQLHIPRSHRARRGSLPAPAAPVAAAALASVIVAARAGALTHLWDFLDYGAGVLSLVSLTATVLWGLVATDRVLLGPGHRLLAQGVHRGLAMAGLGFLALHIWVKVAQQRTTAAAAVVPFADGEQPVLIGLGTLAGYLFVSVAVSGAVRSVFATKSRSLWWRALHIGAYPAWGASLVHGLKAGRPAALWVTAAYALCLVGVATVLAIRLKSRMHGARSRPSPAPAATRARPRPRPGSGSRTGTGTVPRRTVSVGPVPPPRPERPPYAAAYAPGGSDRQPATRERWM